MEIRNLNTPAEIVSAVIDPVSSAPAAQPTAQHNTTGNTAAAGGTGTVATSEAPVVTPTQAARPATYHDLKAALPGADAVFLTQQLEANATVGQAQSAYMAKLAADNQRMASENAELKKTQQVAAGGAALKKPGVAPVSNLPADGKGAAIAVSGDAQAAFEEAVSEEMTRNKRARHEAHAAVCRKQPELRQAMVASHNAEHQQSRRDQR